MSTSDADTQYLTRPEGRLAYDVEGQGPLVVCLPGMGDLRTTFRFMVPALVSDGYRVATLDLRGHGDSDATFSTYDDEALASDALALIDALGGPAVVIGNSMGAGAAVIAAATRPELVRGLALMGPFVREPKLGRATQLMLRVAMAPLWARLVWKSYLPKLYAGQKPADFDAYRDATIAAMKQPGKTKAFSRTTATSHEPAEAAASSVHTPTLVVMGTADPDFPDPQVEAQWVASVLDGQVVMVDNAGHYPQTQRPDIVNPALLEFLGGLDSDG